MAQKTATEKDMFLQTFGQECQITLKLLRAYPPAQGEYRPHEKSRSARELGWTFVMEQHMIDMALQGKIDFSKPGPQPPDTYLDVIPAFENACRETTIKVSRTGDEALNRLVQFPVGPGKMTELRVIDVLWATLMDQVHHRGQFSVYLRLAGAKVPSIYGPSADEPWN